MRHGALLRSFLRYVLNYDWTLKLTASLRMISSRKTMCDTIFKHNFSNLVITEMGPTITYNSTRCTKSGKETFEKFNNSGVIGGERLRFNPFRQVIEGHEYILISSRWWEWSHEIDTPDVKDLTRGSPEGVQTRFPHRARFRMGHKFLEIF